MDHSFRQWLEGHRIGEDTLPYEHQQWTYLILDADIPGLPHFAGYPEGEVLFVSLSVPSEYRRYVLIHEIIEYQDETTCAEAAQREAKLFESDHRDPNERLRYWNFRVQFFLDLIAFEERTNPEGVRIEGFRLSLAFFEGKQSRDWPT